MLFRLLVSASKAWPNITTSIVCSVETVRLPVAASLWFKRSRDDCKIAKAVTSTNNTMYLHAPAVYASLWVSCVRHVPVVSFSQLAGVCCKRLYDCCYRHQRMFRQKSYQQHQEQTRIIPAMIVRSSQIRQQPLLVHVSTMCNNTDWMPRSACKKRIKKSLSSHVVTLTVACSLQHMSLSKNKPNLHVRCLVSTSTQFWEQLQRLRLVLHFDKLCDKVLHKFSLIWGLRRSSPCKCTLTPCNSFCNKGNPAIACMSAYGMSPRLKPATHGWQDGH